MGYHKINCVNCRNDNQFLLVKVKGNRGVDFISPIHNIMICKNCGLCFVNPQLDDKDYIRYYEKFDRIKPNDSIEYYLEKHKYRKIHLKFLINNIKIDKHKERIKVLDVGCGLGIFAYFMKNYGFDVVGLEQSDYAIEFANNKLGLKIHKGWIYDNNLPKNHFDVITCTATIEHLTNPLDALKEIFLLLKPDGYLFINVQDLKGMVLRNGTNSWFKFVHTYYYTDITLSSLINLSGFEIKKVWIMPPIIEYSNLLFPSNFCSGELNIIAKKGKGGGKK